MVDASSVIAVIQFCVLSIIILLTFVYCIPLILIRRFHHRLHVFTINVCMAISCCSIYWLIYYIMTEVKVQEFYKKSTCSLVFYAQTMCTLQVPLALMAVSIHRLCVVVYHSKPFFKSKLWISMCVVCQWLMGIVISLPIFIRNQTVCAMSPWMPYYTLVLVIVVPVSVYVVINIIIFKYVQSSTRRTQPTTTNTINEQTTTKLSRRDAHLLRHMIVMFFVFIVGWGPIYIISVLPTQVSGNLLILRILSLLAEISLLCDMIDLFLYSHDLRKYLQRIHLLCFHP